MENRDSISQHLESSLNTSVKATKLKEDVAKDIFDVFMEGSKQKTRRENQIDNFADTIEKGSEGLKAKFIFTMNFLKDKGLLTTDNIKKVEFKRSSNADDALNSILEQFTKQLDKGDKDNLAKYINEQFTKHNENLATQLKSDNDQRIKDLEQELTVADSLNDTSTEALLENKRNIFSSKKTSIKYGRQIKKIVDSEDKPEKKFYALLKKISNLTDGKQKFRILGKKKGTDIKTRYTDAAKALQDSVSTAKENGDHTKQAIIVYAIKAMDKVYQEYENAITVNKEDRKKAKRDVYSKIAA